MTLTGLACYDFVSQLAALPFVEAIWLFGSRARGDHRERSDIDLAIECPGACEAQWQQVLAIIDEESPQSPLYQAILRDRVSLYRRMTP